MQEQSNTKKIYMYLASIEKNFSKVPILTYFMQIIHFLQLYILINMNLFKGLVEAQVLTQVVNVLQGKAQDGTFSSFILFVPVSISLILFILYYCIIVFHPKKYKLDKFGKLNRILKSVSTILIFFTNFFIVTFLCMMVGFFKSEQFDTHTYFIIFLLPIVVYILLLTFLSSSSWIFSALFPLITILLAVTESSQQSVILITFLSVFFLYKETSLVLVIIYQLLLATCFFELLRVLLAEPIYELEFIFIAFTFLSIILANALSKTFYFSESKVIDNQYLINMYQRLKGVDMSSLSQKVIFEFEKIFVSSVPQFKSEVEDLFSKCSYDKLFWRIINKIQKDKKEHPSFEMDVLYLEYKLISQKDIIQTLLQIKQFTFQERKKNRSFWGEYEIVKLQGKIDDSYFLKNKNHLEAFAIIELSQLSTKFLQIAVGGFKNLESFWIKMKAGIDQKLMEKDFTLALKCKKQMKKIIQTLKKKYAAEKEEKIMEVYQTTFTPYYDPQFILPISDIEIKYHSLSYLITRNEFISEVSFSLLHELGISEIKQNQTLRTLLPPKFKSYIENKYIQKIQEMDDPIIIPLVSASELMILKQCKIYLLPNLEYGIEYFYYFDEIKSDYDCYILLNSHNFLIQNISSNILDQFRLQKETVIKKMNKEALTLRDLLLDLDLDRNMFKFKKDQSVKCHLNLAIFRSSTRNKRDTMVQGYLTQVEQFDSQYQLIGFKRARAAAQNLQGSKMFDGIGQAHDYQKDAKYEKFFCEIPNPFRQKIEEKNREIQEGPKLFSRNRVIGILFLLEFLLLQFLAASYFMYISNQNQTLNDVNEKIKISDDQNFYIVRAFEEVYQQYLIYNNVDEIKQFLVSTDTPYQVQEVADQIRSEIHESLHEFHKNFVFYRYRPYFDVPYEITFEDFVVEANFKGSNLIDFSYNLKLASQRIADQWKNANSLNVSFSSTHQTPHVLDFIFTNYEAYKSLENNFKSIQMFLEEKEQIKIQNIIVILVVLGICTILTIVIYILLLKVNIVFKRTVGIFHKIKKKSIDRVIEEIKIKKKQIEIFNNLQNPFQDETEDSIEINYQKRLKVILEKESAQDKKYEQNSEESELRQSQRGKKNSKKIQDQQDRKTVPQTSTFSILLQNKFYFIYFLFLLLVCYIYFTRIDLHEKEIAVYIEYISNINQNENRYLYLSVNLFQVILSEQLSNDILNLIPKVVEKQIFINLELSDYFQQFKDQQMYMMRKSLCTEDQTGLPEFFQEVNCSKVYRGILTKGFSQTEAIYEKQIYNLMSGKVNLFDIPTYSTYPYFIEHLYTRFKLVRHLQIVEKELIDELSNFVKGMELQGMIFFFTVSSLTFCMFAIFLGSQIKRLQKNSEHCKGFFQIIPRTLMQNMEVVSYIREIQLLNDLGEI